MRVVSLIYLLCILTIYGYGQKDKVLSGDTTFWFKEQHEKEERLGLKDLIQSTDSFHFRFSTDEQAVDIFSTDGSNYNAIVTNYINSYEPFDVEKRTSKSAITYQSQLILDTSTAREAFKLIKTVATIPTDKFIKGWVQGFDGNEYILETTMASTYNFKTYWTPTAQDSNLIEAKLIQRFVKNLDSLLGLRSKYQQFFATLKPGSYIGDGPGVIIKLTQEQIDYFKKTKPYRDYLNSISDTLNHYLSDTLTRIFAKSEEPKCFDQFYLKFLPANKLVEITTNSKFTDKRDKKEFRKCKRLIMAAFKNIRIDFVHSQVDYWVELSFWDGKVNIYSPPWFVSYGPSKK